MPLCLEDNAGVPSTVGGNRGEGGDIWAVQQNVLSSVWSHESGTFNLTEAMQLQVTLMG